MRAKKRAREDRFSRRRSYRFAPYFKRPVAETVSRMETDVKTSTSKPGRCYEYATKDHWSRYCPRKDENRISKNCTSVLGEFENEMNAKVDKILSKVNISSPDGHLWSKVSEWEEIGANRCIFQLIKAVIEFHSKPTTFESRFALNDKEFVTKELENVTKRV